MTKSKLPTINNPWEGSTFGDLNNFGRSKPRKNTENCEYCNGDGSTRHEFENGAAEYISCSACRGTGLREKSK